MRGWAECRSHAGPRGSGRGRVREPWSGARWGPECGSLRRGGVLGKVGIVLQSWRASGFWAECGNRARAQGSGPSARIVLGKVRVRVWGSCRGPGFGYECANHIGQGLGPSSGIVAGCKEGAGVVQGRRVWVRVWELCQGPVFRTECANHIGRGSDPSAQMVSGKVRSPDRIRCTGAGPSTGIVSAHRDRCRVK